MGYPLYPELKEAGQLEAQILVDKFKKQLKKAADEAISDLYCEIAVHIESDSWTNFRNQMMDGFKNYDNRKIQSEYDFKKIREEIYKEFRGDIISDLNQDIVKENEELRQQIEQMREFNIRR